MQLNETQLNNGILPITKCYDYADIMAMYTVTGGLQLQDPENSVAWALKDSTGAPLYVNYNIPYQMAADPSNLAWRVRMLEWMLSRGRMNFSGFLFDDVNYSLSTIANMAGTITAPVVNGVALTEITFAASVNDFLSWLKTELKLAFPALKIIHNTPWRHSPYGVDSWKDSAIIAGWDTTDLIMKENGFGSDTGITGGTGFWSLYALLNYCDGIHSHGRGVHILETDPQWTSYSIACALLMTDGSDYWELRGQKTPQAYVDYGNPICARYRTPKGIWIRLFEKAAIVVSEPGAPTQTYGGINLSAKQGLIVPLS